MRACRCGIRVTLRDGEVRYIEGNPDHPLNQGVICAKGASGFMKQYSPARLTQPLRRKQGAERGSAQFETISWDEAFRVMEERLAHLRATDPKTFAPVLLLMSAHAGSMLPAAVVAFTLQYAGLLAERWFFFAQANHPQNLYYQAAS